MSDSPVTLPVEPKPTRKQRKRAKKWANENRRSFRSTDDIDAMIGAECDVTGCSESEAIKSLIRRGGGKGRIVLSPTIHPESLLKVYSATNDLARSVRSIRARINAPILDVKDLELVALIKEWRKISQELPPKLVAITHEIQTSIRAIT